MDTLSSAHHYVKHLHMDMIPSSFVDEFITVAILQIVAVMSPGPDFAIVVQNSLLYARRVGVMTAAGIAVGVLFHVTLAIFGIGFIIAESSFLLTSFKILASLYLFYMGFTSLKASKTTTKISSLHTSQKTISPCTGFKRGVFTNLLNPKCILFFLTLFTVVVSPTTPRLVIASYGAMIFAITLLWFCFLAMCFSHARIRLSFLSCSHWISRITGVIFLALGLKMLWDVLS